MKHTNVMRRGLNTAQLQAKTLKHAVHHGKAWDNDEVSTVVSMISRDETTYSMAMALDRSYYSIQTVRTHVRFAMDHADALYKQR